MYIFFEQYSEECVLMEKTLRALMADYTFVISKENFFLPEKYVSLQEYKIGRYENITHEERLTDYGFIDVPEFWNIRADPEMGVANIFNMGHKMGVISSRLYKNHRVVTKVDWISETKKIYKTDYYNKYGYICCKVWKDADGKDVMKSYYTEKGEEVLTFDLQSGIIFISEKGVLTKSFVSEEEFLQEVFETLINENETIVVSSVSHVDLIHKIDVEEKAKIVVILSSEGDLRTYRELCVERKKYPVFLPNSVHTAALELQENEYRLCYMADTDRMKKTEKNALIVTTTDWLIGVEELITNVPEVTFHIAANTLVSEKISVLGRYSNVRIHTCIDDVQMRDLMKKSSFYLDINNGRELFNAICEAHMSNLLILGQERTMHNPQYVLQECYFNEDSMKDMISLLCQLNKDEMLYEEYISRQKKRVLDTVWNFATQLGLKGEV